MYNPLTTTMSATMVSPLSPLTQLSISQTPVSALTQTMLSPYSQLSPYSPLSPYSQLSPYSPSVITKYNPLTVVTPIGQPLLYTRPGGYYFDIETGINDNAIVQRDVTKYLRYKTLDKWVYTEFPHLLRYLVVERDKVRVVKSESERDNNKVSKDPVDILSEKSEFIEEKILTEEAMREVLIRIIRETGIKWYDLPYKEELVMDVIEKYIEKKLKKIME
jgi:hypothetical protein